VSRASDKEADGPKLATAAVEQRSIQVVAEAAGLVEPVRVVEVKSNASGEVLSVEVDTGDRVEKGALLAQIDPRDVQSALDQAQADLQSAQVRAATAEAERARNERLLKLGLIAPQDYEATKDTAAAAQATLVRAKATLELAKKRRNDVTIRAPITGTIIERDVQPGQIIASATSGFSGGTTLFQMADLADLQVRAKVDEVDIGQVHPGQTAKVSVETYQGREFVGEVTKIEPQAVVEQNVTLFPVLIHLDNSEGLLKLGMNAEVTIEIASRDDVVAVPNGAVVSLRDSRAAAAVVGLDEDALQAAMRPASPSGSGPGAGSEASDETSKATSSGGAPTSEECMSLFQKMRSGGGTGGASALSADERSKMAECRKQLAARRAGRGGSGSGSSSGSPDEARPALVFVETPQGPEPKRVILGLNDWEFTEVKEGLEPGQQVILVSVAALQKEQQALNNRIRQRMGGPIAGSRSNNRSSSNSNRGGGR
jgi:HlyD family secretion protein